MRIERIDAAYDGDNVSKKIRIYVDEQWRGLSVYLYFVPVVGDEVYTTANPITLGENGEAEYLIPGDVLNGEGCYAAQIVCIDTNGTEIAKSAIFVDDCGASIDDNSAVLPTGEVITLAELAERIGDLTAADIGYVDNEQIGASNVQDAIDYAIEHGGGGGTDLPTFIFRWYTNPTPEQIEDNAEVGAQVLAADAAEAGEYLVYLDVSASGSNVARTYLTCDKITRSAARTELTFQFVSPPDNDGVITRYTMSSAGAQGWIQSPPDTSFDPLSPGPTSAYETALYIDERIGTSGNLNPSSYASASDVSAIEAKIPSAASSSNKLADKNFVNSSISTNTAYFIGTFDSVAELEAYSGTVTNNDYALVTTKNGEGVVTAYNRYKYNGDTQEWLFEYTLNTTGLTSDQVAAINSGITSSKVSTYDAHVADATIHVTAQDKTAWSAKYDKPTAGIPSTDMTSAVQSSLSNGDAALAGLADKQNVPSQVTSGTNITLADNTEYRLTNVTTLTLAYPQGNFECWLRLTFAASGTITVTLPTSSYIGSAPTFANGETWEISIKDGVVVAGKVEASS